MPYKTYKTVNYRAFIWRKKQGIPFPDGHGWYREWSRELEIIWCPPDKVLPTSVVDILADSETNPDNGSDDDDEGEDPTYEIYDDATIDEGSE